MSEIVQLSLFTEKEEEAILAVIEEDFRLQKEEEARIQYVEHFINVCFIWFTLENCVMILQASR